MQKPTAISLRFWPAALATMVVGTSPNPVRRTPTGRDLSGRAPFRRFAASRVLTPALLVVAVLCGCLLNVRASWSLTPCLKQEDDRPAGAASKEGVEACADLLNWIANSEAIRSGEVMIRTRITRDSVRTRNGELNPEGVLLNEETLERVVFDHQTERYCHLVMSVFTETNPAAAELPGGATTVRTSRRAIAWDGDKLSVGKLFPERSYETSESSVQRETARIKEKGAAMTLRPRDPRGFGIGLLSTANSFPRAVERMQHHSQGHHFLSSEVLENGSHALAIRVLDEDTWYRYVFDSRTLMPIEIQPYYYPVHPETGQRVRVDMTKLTFEWEERQGIQVARRGVGSGRIGEQFNGKSHSFDKHVEVEYFWFSLNEELPQSQFDGSCFATLEEFEKSLDPARNGVRFPSDPKDP